MRPLALFVRFGVWKRRPVCDGRFRLRSGIPEGDADVEVARTVRLVGLGRELVDGVPAFLGALDVAIFPASLAEIVAFSPPAVRAATAAAPGDEVSAPLPATGGPPSQATGARLRQIAGLLDRDWAATQTLRALGEGLLQDQGPDGAFGGLASLVTDDTIEVHGDLRFTVATRSASVPERAACARRTVTSCQRGRSASGEPAG